MKRLMKNRIRLFNEQLSIAKKTIKDDLIDYLKDLDYQVKNNQIQIVELNNENDIEKLFSGSGFYIIMTNENFDDNNCTFALLDTTAIYRGHGFKVKKRIMSHLANKKYRGQRKQNDPNYKVCLKIEDNQNGINIDSSPYNLWKWVVIIHKMNNSNKEIREQAELAFDILYNKPCKSREK